MPYKVIYIMGVSASGKTTIGQQLSAKIGFPFYDADNFHSSENITKMNKGLPLADEDRWPWLEKIHQFVTEQITTGNIIMACSALKMTYRELLGRSIEGNCIWVFLGGDFDTIRERLKNRTGHFMPPGLLNSQFDALEIPTEAILVDVTDTPATIIDQIISITADGGSFSIY